MTVVKHSISRKIILFMCTFCLTLLPAVGIAEKEEIMDFPSFDFKITKTDVVDKVSDNYRSIKAKEGYKIVVVTLVGKAPKDGTLFFAPSEFSFIYKKDKDDKMSIKSADAVGSNVILADGGKYSLWCIVEEIASQTVSFHFKSGEDANLMVVCIIDKDVKKFRLRFPAFVPGHAEIKL